MSLDTMESIGEIMKDITPEEFWMMARHKKAEGEKT